MLLIFFFSRKKKQTAHIVATNYNVRRHLRCILMMMVTVHKKKVGCVYARGVWCASRYNWLSSTLQIFIFDNCAIHIINFANLTLLFEKHRKNLIVAVTSAAPIWCAIERGRAPKIKKSGKIYTNFNISFLVQKLTFLNGFGPFCCLSFFFD